MLNLEAILLYRIFYNWCRKRNRVGNVSVKKKMQMHVHIFLSVFGQKDARDLKSLS